MKTISSKKEYNAIVKRISELLEIVTDDNYDTLPQAIELEAGRGEFYRITDFLQN